MSQTPERPQYLQAAMGILVQRAVDDSAAWRKFRSRYYSASGLMRCPRETLYDKAGTPLDPVTYPNPSSIKCMEAGTAIHDYLQGLLVDKRFFEDVEVGFVVHKWLSKGRVDGVLTDRQGTVEFKTKNSYAFSQLSQPDEDHVVQVTLGLVGTGIQKGYIWYICRDTLEAKEFEITVVPAVVQRIEERVELLENSITMRTLPPKPYSDPDKVPCSRCSFRAACYASKTPDWAAIENLPRPKGGAK